MSSSNSPPPGPPEPVDNSDQNALDKQAASSINGSMTIATPPRTREHPAPVAVDPLAALTQTLTPKRAVSYLRVSTREQAERGGREEGFSIPAQREANKKKAQSLGGLVIKEFVERGVSGTSTNRPALKEMLVSCASTPTSTTSSSTSSTAWLATAPTTSTSTSSSTSSTSDSSPPARTSTRLPAACSCTAS